MTVEVLPSSVVDRRGARIGVACGDLHVAKRDSGVEGGHDEGCELRSVLDRIGDKWRVLVIVLLAEGPARYSELHRVLPGISQRMLTLTLRTLERDGLIERTVYAEVPPRVDYRLSALGVTLLEPVHGLATWIAEQGDKVLEARVAFDKRAMK